LSLRPVSCARARNTGDIAGAAKALCLAEDVPLAELSEDLAAAAAAESDAQLPTSTRMREDTPGPSRAGDADGEMDLWDAHGGGAEGATAVGQRPEADTIRLFCAVRSDSSEAESLPSSTRSLRTLLTRALGSRGGSGSRAGSERVFSRCVRNATRHNGLVRRSLACF